MSKNNPSEVDTENVPNQDLGMISLEDIDAFLEEENPEFAMSLNEIVSEELEGDIELESLHLDEENLALEGEEKKKKKILENYPKVQERLDKILGSIKDFFSWANNLGLTVKNVEFELRRLVWLFLKADLPKQIKSFIFWVQKKIQNFWAKNWSEKFLYFGAFIFLVAFISLLVLNLEGRWLPVIFDSYVRSLGDKTSQVKNYKVDEKVSLSAIFPQQTFTVLLEKVVVNLRRSRGHSNPMGAFKFYVMVNSQETAVEVKDRETEILDSIQRAIEDLRYEDVNEPSGRIQIKALVRKEINRLLNQGRVQKVFIEAIITKP